MDTENGVNTLWDVYGGSVLNTATSWPFYLRIVNGFTIAKSQRPCDVDAAFVTYPAPLNNDPIIMLALGLWSPVMTLCSVLDPIVLSSTELRGAYLEGITYPTTEIPWYLDQQIPRGAYMPHELTHLTVTCVGDFDYPLDDVLNSAIRAVKSTEDKNNAQYNAQSYMYFAMAVWFYVNAPSGVTPATFYKGKSNDVLRASTER